MANLRELRRRIRSLRSIAQVTRAMQMVAASKMRRAQAQVLATRPYSEKAQQVLRHLAAQRGAQAALHPLLDVRDEVKSIGLVTITADKGLCGAYNANMARLATRFIEQERRPVQVIAIGRRGASFAARRHWNLIAEYSDLPPQPRMLDISPIVRTVIGAFLEGEVDEVYLGYTHFISTLSQKSMIRRLLPLRTNENSVTGLVETEETRPPAGDYIYEPDPQIILDAVLPRFTEIQIYQVVLESLASEHSARMVAMRGATESANDLLGNLTLTYNQERQSAITGEMLEIASGVEAMRHVR